jgi:hypothetical protein
MATGYRATLDDIFGMQIDMDHPPAGVYPIGFRSRGTGVLREIAIDAQRIARLIASDRA